MVGESRWRCAVLRFRELLEAPVMAAWTCRSRLTVRPQHCHQSQSVQGFPDSHGTGGSEQAHNTGKCLNTSSVCRQTSAEVSGPPLSPDFKVCWTCCIQSCFESCYWCALAQCWTVTEDSKGFQTPLQSQVQVPLNVVQIPTTRWKSCQLHPAIPVLETCK